MTTKMFLLGTKVHRYLTDKYLMSSDIWTPFGDLEYDLLFIPEKYHNMYIRTNWCEDPLHDLMIWISDNELGERNLAECQSFPRKKFAKLLTDTRRMPWIIGGSTLGAQRRGARGGGPYPHTYILDFSSP